MSSIAFPHPGACHWITGPGLEARREGDHPPARGHRDPDAAALDLRGGAERLVGSPLSRSRRPTQRSRPAVRPAAAAERHAPGRLARRRYWVPVMNRGRRRSRGVSQTLVADAGRAPSEADLAFERALPLEPRRRLRLRRRDAAGLGRGGGGDRGRLRACLPQAAALRPRPRRAAGLALRDRPQRRPRRAATVAAAGRARSRAGRRGRRLGARTPSRASARWRSTPPSASSAPRSGS